MDRRQDPPTRSTSAAPTAAAPISTLCTITAPYWLVNQAASGYVTYDPETQRYQLPPEQAVALTDETSPFFVGGGFYVIKAMLRAEPRITEAFKSGSGMRW